MKIPVSDGKMHLTDVADTEQLLRLIQSVRLPATPGQNWNRKQGRAVISPLNAKKGITLQSDNNSI